MGQLLVLIVDGNKRQRAALGRELKKKAIDTAYASTLAEAQNCICRRPHELVVLRLGGQCEKAYQFCRWTRETHPKLKVLALLPCVSSTIESKLFDCGVTDVAAGQQTKLGILSKRIASRLEGCLPQDRILLGTTLVNFDRQEAKRNGQWHKLTPRQMALLKYCIEHPGRLITHAELQDSDIWQKSGWPHRKGGKAVEMAVSKLRKAIEPDPTHPRIILTVRGKGYRLGPDILG